MRHADALRAIGHVLDENEAHEVTIDATPEEVAVSWASASGQSRRTEFRWDELEELQRRSSSLRGPLRAPSTSRSHLGWSDLLRTLGQQLDQDEAGPSTITGDLSWITASWMRDGRYATQHYAASELRAANQRRAAARSPYA